MGTNKKLLYFEETQRLYVIEQLSLAEIARRIPISERTLRSWKEEGSWELKRSEHLRQKQSFHEELFEFTRELMRKVRDDMKSNKETPSGQLYTLTNLLGKIHKLKEYEDETGTATESKTKTDIDEIAKSIQAIIGA